MAKLKAFALSAVALVALSRAASAADLLPPPPMMEPPPISAPEMGGWYIRGDAGVGVNNSPSFTSTPDALALGQAGGVLSANAAEGYFNPSMSEAALLDFGVGYQVNNWFRADVTGELRGGASFHGLQVVTDTAPNAQYYGDLYKTNVTSYLAMLNGYIDLGTWYGVTPFVGAGVGVAFNKAWGGTDIGVAQPNGASPSQAVGGMLASNTTANLAWSLQAGVDFAVTRNLKLELGYRFLDYGKFSTGKSSCYAGANGTGAFFSAANCTGGGYKVASKELTANDFRIGLRYYFDQPSAPPPEMPIVRKY
jgi:opacity protein-like surface antigen